MEIRSEAKKCLDVLKKYKDIVITMHTHPDGDAVGSAVGLAWFLQKELGKNVCIYNEDPLPLRFSFLSVPCAYYTDFAEIPFADPLLVLLDGSELHRFGDTFASYFAGKKSLCIDHHLVDKEIATEYNWIDHTMAATGEMITYVVFAHSEHTFKEAATPLYVALSGDTGNFSFGNTSVDTIECLAKLAATPLDLAPIREQLDNTWTKEKMYFWGKLTSMVRFAVNDKLAYIEIPHTIYAEYGVTREDLEGFVEWMRRVQTVRMTLMMREEIKNGSPFIKVSMRSSGSDDVRSILTIFGGGGHKNAAGAGIEGSLENVFAMLYPHIEKVLQK